MSNNAYTQSTLHICPMPVQYSTDIIHPFPPSDWLKRANGETASGAVHVSAVGSGGRGGRHNQGSRGTLPPDYWCAGTWAEGWLSAGPGSPIPHCRPLTRALPIPHFTTFTHHSSLLAFSCRVVRLPLLFFFFFSSSSSSPSLHFSSSKANIDCLSLLLCPH